MSVKNEDSYYQNRFESFNASSQKVGWKNVHAQEDRFRQFLFLFKEKSSFSLNDLGCGLGDFASFLRINGYRDVSYFGYDHNLKMIEQCQALNDSNQLNFKHISDAKEIKEADYTIASGIFNLRFSKEDIVWRTEIESTLSVLNQKSEKGFGFNILSSFSDKEFHKNELYYADPTYFLGYCLEHFSRDVILSHGYGQYDFTINVLK